MHDVARLKAEARAAAVARRAEAHAAGAGVAERAAERLLAAVDAAPKVVAGYLPIRTEIDPRPAMAGFAARGARLCAPVILRRGAPLAFREWRPDGRTAVGPFGVEVPDGPLLTPELLIAPLLAFDRAGFRLGYGGGFYDRTLAALRAASAITAIGFAFAAQEAAEVPRDATDAPLDLIVTEAETIRPGEPPCA